MTNAWDFVLFHMAAKPVNSNETDRGWQDTFAGNAPAKPVNSNEMDPERTVTEFFG